MSEELKPFFVEPRKSGRTQIRDKYNNLICRTGDEWSRDKIFEALTESEQLRKELETAKKMLNKFGMRDIKNVQEAVRSIKPKGDQDDQ